MKGEYDMDECQMGMDNGGTKGTRGLRMGALPGACEAIGVGISLHCDMG
jgi:hypothetical protein